MPTSQRSLTIASQDSKNLRRQVHRERVKRIKDGGGRNLWCKEIKESRDTGRTKGKLERKVEDQVRLGRNRRWKVLEFRSRATRHVEQIPWKVAGNDAFPFNIQQTIRVPIGISCRKVSRVTSRNDRQAFDFAR